jgi:cellulose synthase/poly-beta-1,6-N-acetylglucosamine synthase-like glycosyltransferase
MIRKDWKSPWFWMNIVLLVIWATFYTLACGLYARPIVTNIWYMLLALLTLIPSYFCGKKLDPPIPVGGQVFLTIGAYLVCTFLPRFANKS